MCFYFVPCFSVCILSIHDCTFVVNSSHKIAGESGRQKRQWKPYLPPPSSPSSRRSYIRSGTSFTLLNNASTWPSISCRISHQQKCRLTIKSVLDSASIDQYFGLTESDARNPTLSTLFRVPMRRKPNQTMLEDVRVPHAKHAVVFAQLEVNGTCIYSPDQI
ncbi:hypothetical protein HanXRQr2_Chr16g0770661 [Helianthus annuus]|uniref:Uncharacterized protein n=1 Tax=Helianthus annuus TaxID=4232 RepID=A0A251VRW1_HELAN|nr:hypothetical protein HanXRQr2_Chr16g0770661 [Helianthus annuus]KAJ0823021.1 hypothetical protein HanPSC8_Chr16g0738791 [Helianthus annuus]